MGILCVFVYVLGVYVNGYRIIDQRVLHGDRTVITRGDVSIANHPFKLTRGPRSVTYLL